MAHMAVRDDMSKPARFLIVDLDSTTGGVHTARAEAESQAKANEIVAALDA